MSTPLRCRGGGKWSRLNRGSRPQNNNHYQSETRRKEQGARSGRAALAAVSPPPPRPPLTLRRRAFLESRSAENKRNAEWRGVNYEDIPSSLLLARAGVAQSGRVITAPILLRRGFNVLRDILKINQASATHDSSN